MANLQQVDETVDERVLLVHAYLDDELDAANAASIGKQISQDLVLASEVRTISALRATMRDKFPPPAVSDHLRARIDSAIGRQAMVSRPSWRALAASVAAAIFLTGGSMLMLRPFPPVQNFAQAVVDSHLRALVTDQVTSVASSDRHTVKPWFNGRITQSPPVVDLAEAGFPLVGGRVDVVDATPVATVVYKRRLHLISVTAIPGAEGATSPPAPIKGYNIVAWRDGQTGYWAISDLNAGELATFSQLFRKASALAVPRMN